jgi:hypothetical protein
VITDGTLNSFELFIYFCVDLLGEKETLRLHLKCNLKATKISAMSALATHLENDDNNYDTLAVLSILI